ncbi:MAG: alpha-amylase family glycosyl hydrolase, partial [Pseudomonadota bacterium]
MYAASLLFLAFFGIAPIHADPCMPGQCVLDDVQAALDSGRPSGRERHPGFGSPLQNAAGRVVFPWDGPGDAMPFELTVPCPGDPAQLVAEVWTNANHNEAPETWEAVPMRLTERADGLCTFTVALPIEEVGNFRATARVSTDGGESFRWVAQGGHDLRFRPHAEEHDGLNLVEINVSSVNGGHGTLDDLAGDGSPVENGRYTLEHLASLGVNAVWVQPPFARSVWEHRHPLDDAGSPYATKDFFAVDPDLSARAQAVLRRGGSQQEAQAAATQEWKDFVAHAHTLGIKVIVDVALNHVGHNHEFSDLFVSTDADGRETREVRRNDLSQIVTDPAQRALVRARLADPSVPPYLEYLAPWLYSSESGDPRGAQDVSDIRSGGGQWHDTKQLNHGGSYGVANPEVNRAVTDWLGRVLEYWAVDMGCDGFRLDHLTGLPERVLDQGLHLGALGRVRDDLGEVVAADLAGFVSLGVTAHEEVRELVVVADVVERHVYDDLDPEGVRPGHEVLPLLGGRGPGLVLAAATPEHLLRAGRQVRVHREEVLGGVRAARVVERV